MRKMLLLLLSLSLLFLAGCSRAEDYARAQILQGSGILEDADYKEYKAMEADGKLDEQGYALPDSDNEEDLPSDKIRVTFANNSYLKIAYYYDAELKNPVDTAHCYLDPGDSLYASEPEVDSPNSNMYRFSEFRIWQYDSSGRRSIFQTSEHGGNNPVLTIPRDYTGAGFSVEPLGEYENRILSLSDYYIDSAGKRIELNGKWTVDDVTTSGNSAEVSPIVSYTIVYDFSNYNQEYYFDGSSPTNYYSNDKKGEVVFYEMSAKEGETLEYTVRLHPYVKVTVINEDAAFIPALSSTDIIKSIEVNGEEREFGKGKETALMKLKCGDKIIVNVGSGYAVSSGIDTEITHSEVIGGGIEYAITVPDTRDNQFSITVSKSRTISGGYVQKTVPNAVFTVQDADGNELRPGDEPDDSAKVTVTITPVEGYYISGKEVKDNIYQDTMKYKNYVSDIDTIIQEHPVRPFWYVTLETADDYGTCVYTLDGQEVSGTVALREGQKLKLEYTLTNSEYQIVKRSGLVSAIEGIIGKNKITVSVDISENLDGATIRRADYIEVAKK